MIAKSVGSITKTSLKKLRLRFKEYGCPDYGGVIRNYGTTVICFIFKIIKPDTRFGVSNSKYLIEKSTLAKFGNNFKYLLDDMTSNYSIILEEG